MPPSRPPRYLTSEDTKDFLTAEQIRAMVRAELSPHGSKLDDLKAQIQEVYGNGSGKLGYLEKIERKQDARWQEWQLSQADVNQKMLNFMFRNEQEAEKAEMRAELVKEIAADREKDWKLVRAWVKAGGGAGIFTVVWEVSMRIWHFYHPALVHIAK